jgi:copper transport protein
LPDRDLGPLPVVLRREGPGRYAGLVRLTLPGSWQLAVTVRTSDIDQTTVRIPLDISG